ncbi:indolepyruvate ferredoxin oxidoreductase family protein [Dactylosporangium sp. CA-092794]|uniref:indolepyruvate ferredoxin oxidoreductase family protein n=1 Tax=Dactylosporangium sp. CA-092794 TaxID=3239929 RepID=UPI003D8F33BE
MRAASGGGFSLDDRYASDGGAVYLTGIQALVRMLLDRAAVDRRDGVQTATYVSGYEGSPLAGYDLELARQRARLQALGIVHQPGLNEELAATAVSGTQLARTIGTLRPDGVTGVWYGKAPGLDRATDALRHANLIGTDPRGGAVALVGDDPAAKSSSVPCSSEFALADLAIPTFSPADPAEIVEHGLHAVELSRASGLWSAMRIATVVADGAATTELLPGWTAPSMDDLPGGLTAYSHEPSAHLLGTRLEALERSFHRSRLPVAVEYVRRSGLNRIRGARDGRIGIAAAGSTYLAVRQALTSLGLDDAALERAGVRLLQLAVVFPVEPAIVREFAAGLEALVVVEDKRAFLEDAIKAILYRTADAPPVYGKRGEDGSALFAADGEHDADTVSAGLWRFLNARDVTGLKRPPAPRERLNLVAAHRMPYFCSGCPHNSSTEVAPGTTVGGGIGCHAMLLLMPGDRAGKVTGLSQMGGEGAQWIGATHFVEQDHFVQNLGDGTFAHSGSLAVRAAVDAGANVTFKVLRNSAVAMTGGQRPVGEKTLPDLVALLRAEGVRRIVVTTDDPKAVRKQVGRAVPVRHRDDLLDVQRELAGVPGVTVLIHDQECAAEKRRKRRRGKAPLPARRVLINERVCEGCGDCGAKSNCLSVEPVATEFGRKTRINQSSCNLDFSCLEGDCPSFLTVVPGRRTARDLAEVAAPPEPARVVPAEPFTMRITGIGGTGIVTVSQILATAAAIDGRAVRALDQTGLAQKGGAVVSDLVITASPTARSPKLAARECDLYLGCDALVATDAKHLAAADATRTVAVLSSAPVPTGAMVTDPAVPYPGRAGIEATMRSASRALHVLDAAAASRTHLGSEQYANVILVGAAYQVGALPLTAESIEAAIRLNGTAVDANIAAFRRGRRLVAEPGDAGADPRTFGVTSERPASVDCDRLRDDLAAYQNARYAERFLDRVRRVRAREAEVTGSTALGDAVAVNLHKLMAYKDEYEVARLSLDPQLGGTITDAFGEGARVRYRLHPPMLRALGLRHKISLGPWMRPVFRVLIAMRHLRGTRLDPFGFAAVRRTERELVGDYQSAVDVLLDGLTADNHELAVRIATLPDLVRGYEDIKLRNVERYRSRKAELLREFANTAAA